MLSALVQSQAAIVAIVVSLTLIAVQLTASAYTPRVIRIFLKTPDMWYLLSFYAFSIFLGLLFLKMIRVGEDSSQILIFHSSLEDSIIFIYALGISSFALLFLYFGNTINLLNPANIIHQLQIEITKDNLLNSEEDPIQPIMDIVHGSSMKYDLETTRVGLKAVTDRMIEIIDSDEEEGISRRFCDHLERAGRLAISREDEELSEEVINGLEKFAKSAVEKRIATATVQAAESIRMVAIVAAKNKLEDATSRAADSLGNIGNSAAKEEGFAGGRRQAAGVTTQTLVSLEKVGRVAAENELDGAVKRVAFSLLRVGITVIERGFKLQTDDAAKHLAELALLNEEVVETAIQDYESRLKEEYRDAFQKFTKIYEQEFEKLRAEK
jgi:hypothetical protein